MELYASAAPTSLELLCIASMKDAAQFVRNHEHLFKEKTRSVAIMGGVMPFEDDDETTLLVPGTVGRAAVCASTHIFLLSAFSPSGTGAQQPVRRRELRLFLSAMPRAQDSDDRHEPPCAAYECPMPRSIYDAIRSTIVLPLLRADVCFKTRRKSISRCAEIPYTKSLGEWELP